MGVVSWVVEWSWEWCSGVSGGSGVVEWSDESGVVGVV